MTISSTNFRANSPEIERAFHRDPGLGYEPEEAIGLLQCLQHGAPNQLIRWHFHEEYELHLILNSSGQMFVGDYIGQFSPGNLVLVGPHLPHNWVSQDLPSEGLEQRDLVIQFSNDSIRQVIELLPELREIRPLLDRARNGVEFFGISELATRRMRRIQQSHGVARLIEFCHLMQELNHHQEYKLLSSVQLQSFNDDQSSDRISEVVDYISSSFDSRLALTEVAAKFGMSESRFSRYFRRMTGNTFTAFVNQLRIHKACELLLETEQYVSTICYAVGFNNLANFNRRFMELKGMTPTDFRRVGRSRY